MARLVPGWLRQVGRNVDRLHCFMHMAIGLTCEGKRYVLSPSLLPRLGAVAVTVTTTPRLIGSR